MDLNPIASDEVRKKRLEICEVCPEKVIRWNMNVCNKCGCVLQTKARLKNFKCPLDKWPI